MKKPYYSASQILIVVLHVAVLVLGFVLGNNELKDSQEYQHQAKNIAEHGIPYAADLSEPINEKFYSRRPPGYALFLVALDFFGGWNGLIFILQILFSLGISFLVLIWMQRKTGHSPALLAVPLGLILFPSQLIHTQLIMADILFMVLLFLWLWFSKEYFVSQKLRSIWFANIFLALALFTKPALLYFWPLNLAVLAWFSIRHKKKFTWLPALLPAVVVFIVGWINLQNTGYFHYSSIQASNIVSYNAYPVAEKVHGADSATALIQSWYSEAEKENNLQGWMQMVQSKSVNLILKHPVQYGLFHMKGVVNFFLDPGRYDLVNFFGIESQSQGLMEIFRSKGYGAAWGALKDAPVVLLAAMAVIFLWNIFLLAAFIWVIFAGPMEKFTKVLLVLVVLYIAFISGPVGTARYKADIYPMMLLTVPLFLEFIRQKSSQKVN